MAANLIKAENFSIVPLSGEIATMLTEELDGLGQVPFDAVKIPSGGGLAFEVPGDDPDNPETVQALTGVIVHHHPVNVYWEHDFDGSGGLPDCSSPDGKRGLDTRTGEIRDCAACPFNQFGSGGKGSAKACKNTHRVYLLRENDALPILLTLPPTSLRAFKDYLAKRLIMKGKRSADVITCIKLKREKNADGIAYSACVFSKAADLTAGQIETIQPTCAWVKAAASQVPVVEQSAEPDPAGGFVDVPDDEPTPF